MRGDYTTNVLKHVQKLSRQGPFGFWHTGTTILLQVFRYRIVRRPIPLPVLTRVRKWTERLRNRL